MTTPHHTPRWAVTPSGLWARVHRIHLAEDAQYLATTYAALPERFVLAQQSSDPLTRAVACYQNAVDHATALHNELETAMHAVDEIQYLALKPNPGQLRHKLARKGQRP